MDFFTDCFKLKIHFIIRKTKNIQAVLRKDAAPFTVIQKPLFGGVLCSIQFDDQLCARTVKISNKRFNDALLINFYRVAAQKLIPKLSLLRRHFAAQLACTRQHIAIFGNDVRFHRKHLLSV